MKQKLDKIKKVPTTPNKEKWQRSIMSLFDQNKQTQQSSNRTQKKLASSSPTNINNFTRKFTTTNKKERKIQSKELKL